MPNETKKSAKAQIAWLQNVLDANPQIDRDELVRSLELGVSLEHLGITRHSFNLASPVSIRRVRLVERHQGTKDMPGTHQSLLKR
jgi:hypothetical protein